MSVLGVRVDPWDYLYLVLCSTITPYDLYFPAVRFIFPVAMGRLIKNGIVLDFKPRSTITTTCTRMRSSEARLARQPSPITKQNGTIRLEGLTCPADTPPAIGVAPRGRPPRTRQRQARLVKATPVPTPDVVDPRQTLRHRSGLPTARLPVRFRLAGREEAEAAAVKEIVPPERVLSALAPEHHAPDGPSAVGRRWRCRLAPRHGVRPGGQDDAHHGEPGLARLRYQLVQCRPPWLVSGIARTAVGCARRGRRRGRSAP